MGKKLHMDRAAEREATDIGAKFMHSSDVVGDMSRAYGRDLSDLRIHTDESAARGRRSGVWTPSPPEGMCSSPGAPSTGATPPAGACWPMS